MQLVHADRNASWQISVAADGVIYSKFVGPTPSDEIAAFIEALVAIMPQANARLVFDLRELGGYNSETKAPMKAWLLRHKLAILELTVLVPKSGTILKVVVAAIALASGVKIRIREDLEEAARVVSP
jgi:predicted lysophospholipase L1 biosynthesis ABC-type transport system permease subunit